MQTLSLMHPQIAAAFKDGKFAVHKSKRIFSANALDQAHEQSNARVKSDGGTIGLTENSYALLRWMIAGPEVARVIKEFDIACGDTTTTDETHHHEPTSGTQCTFFNKWFLL